MDRWYTQPMQKLFDDSASGFAAYTEALRRHGAGIRRFFDDSESLVHAAYAEALGRHGVGIRNGMTGP